MRNVGYWSSAAARRDWLRPWPPMKTRAGHPDPGARRHRAASCSSASTTGSACTTRRGADRTGVRRPLHRQARGHRHPGDARHDGSVHVQGPEGHRRLGPRGPGGDPGRGDRAGHGLPGAHPRRAHHPLGYARRASLPPAPPSAWSTWRATCPASGWSSWARAISA